MYQCNFNAFFRVGWEGDNCNTPTCLDGCDPVGGYCTVPFTCECSLGYSGKLCDIGNMFLSLQYLHCSFSADSTEGLGLNLTYSSSLTFVSSYLNSSIYFDLSKNSFISYKVKLQTFAPIALVDSR